MTFTAQDLQSYIAYLSPRVVNHHLSRPYFYTANTLFFHLSGKENRFVISLDDQMPRFYVAEEDLDERTIESKFLDVLEKELANGYVTGIEEVNGDRAVRFSFTIINGVYKEEGRSLYFEMLPHHANLILTDALDTILAAYRPGEMEDERPMLKGLKYLPMAKKDFALQATPFDPKAYEALCRSKENEIAARRKKDRFGYLFEALKKKSKLLERKLSALEGDRSAAESHLNDGAKGDAIYVNYSSLNNRQGSFVYEGETIALDPSRSLSQNAELYYKRAKKAKETLKLYEANKASAEKELLDVQSALLLLQEADESGLEALAKELQISPQKAPQKKKNGDWRGLSHDSIPYEVEENGTKILFGKSAKQNDCLSFLLDTAKEHSWLHVQGTTGSHVMIKKDNASDEDIRTAAEICLINSALEDGDVILAKRKDVRKGSVMGQAIVKTFTTIHLKNVRPETKNLVLKAEKMKLG